MAPWRHRGTKPPGTCGDRAEKCSTLEADIEETDVDKMEIFALRDSLTISVFIYAICFTLPIVVNA